MRVAHERALHELRVQMIPAYSPEARGRSQRSFGTWQGRLPQQLRLRQIRTLEAANRFCGKTTSPSSTAVFRSRPDSGGATNQQSQISDTPPAEAP